MSNDPYVQIDVTGSDDQPTSYIASIIYTALNNVGFTSVSLEVSDPVHHPEQMKMVEAMNGVAVDFDFVDNSYEIDVAPDLPITILR